MRLHTAHRRAKRNFYKRLGHTFLAARRGVWLHIEPEWAAMGAQCMLNGEEQPRFYRYYP